VGVKGDDADGTFTSTFRRANGDPVRVKAGDKVKHSQSSRSFTVPTRSLEVDVENASLTMTCPANGQYVVVVDGERLGSGPSGASGAIAENELDANGPLGPGIVIEVRCDNRRGYGLLERVVLD
jgi:hypothetical protein